MLRIICLLFFLDSLINTMSQSTFSKAPLASNVTRKAPFSPLLFACKIFFQNFNGYVARAFFNIAKKIIGFCGVKMKNTNNFFYQHGERMRDRDGSIGFRSCRINVGSFDDRFYVGNQKRVAVRQVILLPVEWGVKKILE